MKFLEFYHFFVEFTIISKKKKQIFVKHQLSVLDRKTNRTVAGFSTEIYIDGESKQKDGNSAPPSLQMYVYKYLSICFQIQQMFID